MYKESDIMFMYAETSVHVGGGESVGAIDLAIARERYTEFPFIPSSGVKGAIRSWWKSNGDKNTDIIFGPGNDGSEHAGAAIFTDARLLLFPVRSLKGVFAWITCPLVIERFKRDLRIADNKDDIDIEQLKPTDEDKAIVPKNSQNFVDGSIVLEEYTFEGKKIDTSELTGFLKKAFPDDEAYSYWKKKLDTNLIILHDDAFRDFVKSSTEVQARIQIDSKTKTVNDGALFYQENLPSDTLLYTVAATHDSFKNGDDKTAKNIFKQLSTMNSQNFQLGGNESIGKGIFNLNFMNGKNGGSDETDN